MQLPEGKKIIGLIVADEENAEGEIFWDQWFFKDPQIFHADIMKDVSGLTERKYEEISAIALKDIVK